MPSRHAPLLALLAFAVGCTMPVASSPDDLHSARAPITHADDDPGDSSVVAIVTPSRTAYCTGTLIGPHTVLTASHCQISPSSYASYRVFFGSDVAGEGTLVDISDARPHPEFDAATFAHDLALLTLAQDVPFEPIPIDPRAVDESLVDETFQAVGFGRTAPTASDEGRKRIGTAHVAAVGTLDFTTKAAPSQPCVVDSGGPALFTDGDTTYITGVVSHGDSECADHATYARIDVGLASFIQPYLDETAPGTAKPGERCLYPGQCSDSVCVGATDEPRIMYCAPACESGDGCPSGMECTAVDGLGSQCRYPLPTAGAVGWPCASDDDCRFSECTERGICSRRCVSGNGDCPTGFACTNLDGIDFYCMPNPSTPQPREETSCACAEGPGRPGTLAWGACEALAALLIARRRTGAVAPSA